VTDVVETTEQETPPTGGVPPQAFDRVKAEAASYKEAAEVSGQALAKREWVDKLYDHFNGLEGDAKLANPFEAAKAAAEYLPVDTENISEAVAAFNARMSAMQPQTVADAPPPPMAGDDGTGPQPGATGGELENGPFSMKSPEFKKFFEDNGKQATNVAIANGMFYPSDENQAAQSTLDSV